MPLAWWSVVWVSVTCFRSNQAASILVNVTGGEASFFADQVWLLGIIMALCVGIVIIGGIKSVGYYLKVSAWNGAASTL